MGECRCIIPQWGVRSWWSAPCRQHTYAAFLGWSLPHLGNGPSLGCQHWGHHYIPCRDMTHSPGLSGLLTVTLVSFFPAEKEWDQEEERPKAASLAMVCLTSGVDHIVVSGGTRVNSGCCFDWWTGPPLLSRNSSKCAVATSRLLEGYLLTWGQHQCSPDLSCAGLSETGANFNRALDYTLSANEGDRGAVVLSHQHSFGGPSAVFPWRLHTTYSSPKVDAHLLYQGHICEKTQELPVFQHHHEVEISIFQIDGGEPVSWLWQFHQSPGG